MEGGEGNQKNAKKGNKSKIELKLSNFWYHRNWYRHFANKLQINASKNTYDQTSFDKSILNKENKIWNTNELVDAYRNKGATESNSTRLVNQIQQHLKDEIYCFKARGVAAVIMNKKKASATLNLVTNQDKDEYIYIYKLTRLLCKLNQK